MRPNEKQRPAATGAPRDKGPGADQPSDGASDRPENPPQGCHTVTDALNRMVQVGCLDNARGTIECYLQRAGHVMRLLGQISVRQLHLDDVQEYCSRRLREGAARETVRKELVALRRALSLAAQRGLLRSDPAALIPRFRAAYTPRRRWLTQKDFERLLIPFTPERRRWLLLATFGGCRLSEVEGLRWEHVDFANKDLLVPGTKTKGSHRRIPLHPLLQTELERETGASESPLTPAWRNVRRDLAKACEQLGLARVSPNDLRRTFASWLKQAQVDSFVVAQLLGHSSSRMVELVYGRLDAKTLEGAVNRLPSVKTHS